MTEIEEYEMKRIFQFLASIDNNINALADEFIKRHMSLPSFSRAPEIPLNKNYSRMENQLFHIRAKLAWLNTDISGFLWALQNCDDERRV
jgi:hypothetical protein